MMNDVATVLQNIASIFPQMLMTVLGLVLIVIDVMAGKDKKAGVGYFGIAFIIVALLLTYPFGGGRYFGFDQMLVWDRYSYSFFLIFGVAYILTTLGAVDYLDREKMHKGEFYTILFFSIIGMMFMVSALDLSVFYVGLETMAISMYVMAGFNRKCQKSNEAGVKYFIIGAFSSGLLLFGMSYVYGFAGSTFYKDIFAALQTQGVAGLNIKLGLVMMLAGFAFKISAVPFHMWAPDVYSGAPTPVTGFMTVAPKAAAFGALIRFCWLAIGPAAEQWQLFFGILAVITMFYGNFVALAQKNVKRMLAYSAISHAGYAMIGLVASNELGYRAIALYMLIYGFMNIGAFTIIGLLKNKGGVEDESLDSFAGLAKKHPMSALAMLIFMFSLAGIPPLAGFIGKFTIFMAAVQSKLYWLAIIGALNSAIACYYYMRVTIYMYFKDAEYDVEATMQPVAFVATFIAAIFVLLIGVMPSMFVNIVKSLII